MATLEGVRVGAMDPDTTRDFGRVAAENSARALIRHHARLLPAALRTILSLPLNDDRSLDTVIDLQEVDEVVRGALAADNERVPKGFVIKGANVRGTDGQPLWLTYVYEVKSGRTAKGAVPFNDESFPRSYAAGEDAVRARALRRDGMPIERTLALIAAAMGTGELAPVRTQEALGDENAQALLETMNALLESQRALLDRVADLEADLEAARSGADDDDDGDGDGEADGDEPDPGAPTVPPIEAELPWEGYLEQGSTVHTIAARLKEDGSSELAQRVLDYETAPSGPNRGTVTKAANAILDKNAPGE